MAVSKQVRLILAFLVGFGCAIGLFIVAYGYRDDAVEAEQTTEKAVSAKEQAEADAAALFEALTAQCDAGIQSACHQLRGLEPPAEIQDDETQDPEIQEPERQERETQEAEIQERERQERERQEPEAQDGEDQDGEVDDPDPDDPETQDPEVDDPDPNDPQDPPESITFSTPAGTWVCALNPGSPPRNPTYTCGPA